MLLQSFPAYNLQQGDIQNPLFFSFRQFNFMQSQTTPKMYTSYWHRINQLQEAGIVPIGICLAIPVWAKANNYKKLAPSYSIWKEEDNEVYTTRFNTEVLESLSAIEIVNDLVGVSQGQDFALLCYEKPSDFCHRHLVAAWLKENGFHIEEWTPIAKPIIPATKAAPNPDNNQLSFGF